MRWTGRGLYLADGSGRTVDVGERGFLLMPSAYLWPYVAAVIEQPWQPTIIYPGPALLRAPEEGAHVRSARSARLR